MPRRGGIRPDATPPRVGRDVREVTMQQRPGRAGDEGFTLIEVVVALGVFALLATAFASSLSASLRSLGLSRQRTTAEQLASSQMEEMRRVAYDDLGTVGGNPPGIVTATKSVTNGSQTLTVDTRISYVNDKAPIAKETGADYKSVTVTVTSATATVLAVSGRSWPRRRRRRRPTGSSRSRSPTTPGRT